MVRPALAGAALLLLLNLLAFTAAIYHRFAEQRLDALPDERAARAAALASSLAPWSATHAALHGWIEAEAGNLAATEAAYRKALRTAAADPVLWAEYALALTRNDVFDERLTLATRRALELAPSSPAVRHSVSRMALSYWRFGSTELRELWQQTLRWDLDHNRDAFLQDISLEGWRAAFCAQHAATLGEEVWCSRP